MPKQDSSVVTVLIVFGRGGGSRPTSFLLLLYHFPHFLARKKQAKRHCALHAHSLAEYETVRNITLSTHTKRLRSYTRYERQLTSGVVVFWGGAVFGQVQRGWCKGAFACMETSGLRSATLTRRFLVGSRLGWGIGRGGKQAKMARDCHFASFAYFAIVLSSFRVYRGARFLAILPLIPLNLYRITEEKESFFTVFWKKTSKKR